MSIDTAIPMETVREKLRNLQQYMPRRGEAVYKFGKFLAEKLDSQLSPIGFSMTAELTLCDLEKGIDALSNQPIRSKLAGCHPGVYNLLRVIVPDIAEAVCPEDFARDVRESQG